MQQTWRNQFVAELMAFSLDRGLLIGKAIMERWPIMAFTAELTEFRSLFGFGNNRVLYSNIHMYVFTGFELRNYAIL